MLRSMLFSEYLLERLGTGSTVSCPFSSTTSFIVSVKPRINYTFKKLTKTLLTGFICIFGFVI